MRSALVAAALVAGIAAAPAWAQNPIVTENQNVGDTDWDIGNAGTGNVEGFATDISVNKGETVYFKINTAATAYTIDIYRIGYYGGAGARKWATITPSASLPQIQPARLFDTATGLMDCGNWAVSASWAVPADAVSGVYVAKVTTNNGGLTHILFIVRDDASTSAVYFKTSDATWQAYNTWGGNSLYVAGSSPPPPYGHASKVSYNRPFITRNSPTEDNFFNAEYPMIRWLEANGYDVSYTTDIDADRRGGLILNHKVFLSVGHDEYWSAAERTAVEAARNAGVHLAFFSGNEVYWKIRWENSIDGSGTSYRTLVCYKEGTLGEYNCGGICDPTTTWTGLWRDGCANLAEKPDACNPENALAGNISWVGTTGAIQVPQEYGSLRFWRNTSVATLPVGGVAVLPNGTLGYEWDAYRSDYASYYPAGRITLSSTSYSGQLHHLSLYRYAPSGALVFSSGTVQWSWGLDSNHDRGSTAPDIRMQQATVNLLADMDAQPATLQAGLVPASKSSDTAAPTSTVDAPQTGSTVKINTGVTITGTAIDAGGGVVAAVEVSADGGATWKTAAGKGSWSYLWTPTAYGAVNIKCRAVDDSGNLETPGAGVTVTVGDVASGPPHTPVASSDYYSTDRNVPITVAAPGVLGNDTDPDGQTLTAELRNAPTHGDLTLNADGSFTYTPALDFAGNDQFTYSARNSGYGNLSNPATAWISVAQTCPCTIFEPAAAPVSPYEADPSALELGVKFRTDVDGWITGVRFYKHTQNSGVHVARLWDAAATTTPLAVQQFTGETASGWQQVDFASPVPIVANHVYVATYHTSTGYAQDTYSFTAYGKDNPPLHALVDGESGPNGVYAYGAGGTFPTTGYSSSNYYVDVVFQTEVGPDVTPPQVTARSPGADATGVAVGSSVTVTFNEPIDPLTVSGTTFELRDPANALVPATVTYTSATRTATLAPSTALAYLATYTATLKGGASGINDLAGIDLAADQTWSFTTAQMPPPPPDEGPGGPILVVGSASNPFTRYYAEILRTEGLNAFMVRDISLIDAGYLAGYDVVMLGEMPLSSAQVQMFADWVAAGGNLIAMRPDKQLAGLLGLTDAGTTLANQYLRVDTGTAPGAGIVSETIQFHGTADQYALNGAAALATLYSSATTATPYPAVTMRSVGSNGGVAAAFAYDLARSVVYTRQGNPAWEGDERDGVGPLRSDDMFYGAKAGDVQPDWIDLTKVAIPQADEQQRLLANLILKTNMDRKPLPRFWYFPKGFKAVIIMTGDDHGSSGSVTRFNGNLAQSPEGCSVDDWECVRSSIYLYPGGGLTDAQAIAYHGQGFEMGRHMDTGCANWTPSSLASIYDSQLATFASTYPSLPRQESHRTHCIAWSDWATQAEVEAARGIRLDTNYYYWPPAWVAGRSGMFTGSGMPMRFAKLDGTMIDCFQANTNVPDESGFNIPVAAATLMDHAVGALGYYGAFTMNMHAGSDGACSAIVTEAQARGVPVVSGRQMLRWLDGRNSSKFQDLNWSGNLLSFSIVPGDGARNLEAMLPVAGGVGDLTGITLNGSPITYRTEVVKGLEYAIFPATSGAYTAQYLQDTFAPVISAVAVTQPDDGVAVITWTTNEMSTSKVVYGTTPSMTLTAENTAPVTSHSLTLTGLAPNQTYYYRLSSADDAVPPNTGYYPGELTSATFTTPPLACLKDDTQAQFAQGTPGAGTVVTSTGNGAVTLAMSGGSEFNGTALDAGWEEVKWTPYTGGATFGGGLVQLDGTMIRTTADYAAGQTLEFMATFTGTANEHAGFAIDLSGTQWAIFSTMGGGGLYARVNAASQVNPQIPGSWLGAPHLYRIEWNTGGVTFYIDGNQVATTTVSPTSNLRPVASDLTVGGTVLTVDWMRMLPYAASGSYLSRVYGSASPSTWGMASWTAQVPANTSLAMYVHTGETPTPDETWTAFAPIAASGDIVGGRSRYIQYRADLGTTDGAVAPMLEMMHLACTAEEDLVAPVISGVTPTPAATSATVAWATDEVANSWVEYGTVSGNLDQHVSAPAFTTAHSLLITGLTPVTQYYYRVKSTDPSGNAKTEPAEGELTFTTLADVVPPVISGVTATLAPAGTEATIAWTTDEAATSRVLYGTNPSSLTLTADVPGLATAHSVPLTGLTAGHTYYYRVRSVDAYGNEAIFPATPAGPLSFGTPQEACFTDATTADFGQGDVGTGTFVEEKADGEVVLKPALSTDFTGTSLPTGWVEKLWPYGTGNSYSVADGRVSVDGYRVMPDPYAVGPGHSVEFVATFGGEVHQHAGFGAGGQTAPEVFNSNPWAMFSTYTTTNTLHARTNISGVEVNYPIPGSWLGTPHRYRVDWGASQVDFYIDGELKHTDARAVPGPMRPAISDLTGNGGLLTVDWMRVLPFAESGTFTSRIFSRSTVSTWHVVSWTEELPAGTGIAVGVRTGNTPAPDASWTGFTPVGSGQELAVDSRYVQYQAALSTADGLATPALRDLTITCEAYDDAVAPVISDIVATPDPNGTQATITWVTDEVADARVDYGTNPEELGTNVSSALFFTAHSLQLTGLTPGTTYYYRVTSVDPSANSATAPVSPAEPLSFATPVHSTPPVISDVTASAGDVSATVTWTTDEAATSVVRYGLTSELGLTATVEGLVTAHSVSLSGLAPGTTYYYRVESADGSSNTSTFPDPPAEPLSFATLAMPCPSDVTAAHFALGTPDANTEIVSVGDGEVVLKPTLREEFSGDALPTGWTPTAHGGAYQVSGGRLTLDGYLVQPPGGGGYGRTLEFVATFGPQTYQHVGFNSGGDLWTNYILISTSGFTDGVYARINDSGVKIGGTELFGSPHRYKLVWKQTSVDFYVDGELKVNRPSAVAVSLYPIICEYNATGANLAVDWLEMTPYLSPGVYTSRVFDQTGPTDWGVVTWNATLPTNTGLAVGVRTSTTTPPEAGWTPFAPVANGASVGENARYLQYQATLTSSDGSATPSLESIAFTCAPGFDLTLPVISNVAATATGTTATITWDTDEFSNSRVDYGTEPGALGQNVSDAAIVRAHSVPLTGLTPDVTYYFRVSSTDRAGHAATDPSPPETHSFTTTMPVCFADQDSTHFGAGTRNGTAVSIVSDGEVILAPTMGDEFSGSTLSSDWYVHSWGGPGCTVAAGQVTVNGARLSPTSLATYSAGRVMTFRTTFTGPGQHVGLAAGDNLATGMFNTATWAIFSTGTQSSVLYARVNTVDVSLGTNYTGGTNYIGYPHDYWIEWRADSVVFLVDGRSVSRQANAPSAGLRPGVSDNTLSTAAVPVDWVRLTPYAASGTFTSRVYDGGEPKSWGAMSWTATLPTGTSLAMSVRGGPVADPLGGGWTDWQAVGASGGSVGLCTRYVQYKADLATTDLAQTPTLKDVAITCGAAGTVAAVTELSATPATSDHDASGRAKIQLTWTGGGGGGGGVKVYRKAYGDYPLYRVGHGAEPAAPASPAAALSAGWTLVTGVTASGQSDQPPDRDYWYYVAFDTDVCGNASPVSNRTGGTLDYLLGDVSDGSAPCAGDNLVNTADVSLLGALYGTSVAGPEDPNACLDVGPTTTRQPSGRPVPDGLLAFEDLIMFAMNYTLPPAGPGALAATPRPAAPEAAAADAVTLAASATARVGETFSVAVQATGAGDLQAVTLTLDYDRVVVEMVKAEPGELLARQAAPAVVLSPQAGQVDVALLGKGARLSGAGELARVEFRVRAAGDPRVVLARAEGRDGQNAAVALVGATPPAAPKLPAVTRMAPARPNPFAQTVTLGFGLAAGGDVELTVFSVDGRRVRTLVRGVREPGEYEVVWDGRDESGRAVTAGVYFARLTTPQQRFTQAVTYLK